MDPTVQVAAFGIVATIISTAGVVIVAFISKSSPTAPKSSSTDPPSDDDEANLLELLELLLRKQATIKSYEQSTAQLKATIEDLEEDNERLRADRQYCRENHSE